MPFHPIVVSSNAVGGRTRGLPLQRLPRAVLPRNRKLDGGPEACAEMLGLYSAAAIGPRFCLFSLLPPKSSRNQLFSRPKRHGKYRNISSLREK